jgi:signal recognition particle subunit SRP54
MLVAADLQRPNAVTQLEVVGQRAGVPVYAPERGNVGGHDAVGPTGEGTRSFGDPVAVSRAGIEQARRAQHDVVIVDTAGRLAVDADLMQQAADIRAAISPDEVLFVIDAMIGQAAVETALAFQDGVDFTGVVLSKLDGDARGGAALSVASVTGRPIMFASTGEQVKDFEVFHPDRMASRILDMGDVLTLIEQAERAFDRSQAEEMQRKFLAEEDFTFDDFLGQMAALKKMGGLKSMLGMMPGMGQMKAQLDNLDPKEFDRVEAMVRSMTPFERTHSKQINGSRRARIAKGSGVEVSEVNALLERFTEAQKMMKQLARGGGIPGMPGMGGGPGKRGKQQPQRKKSKSGNPAKRAAEERAAAERANAPKTAPTGASFGGGTGAGNGAPDLDPANLPAGFEKFLGR